MYGELPKLKPDEILVYLRKSRSDDPAMSVEEVLQKHEAILKDWAERNLDAPVPEENIYREVVSGETIEGRPEIQKLLQRMESPKIKAILTVEVQRLSRGDLEDCGRLMKLLRYTHTHVITPMKTYNLDDDYDRDGFERELKRGNEYLEYFKKIQRRGKLASIREGNFTGATAPYGYRKTSVTIGRKKCPTLEVIEDEAQVVRMIFDWYCNSGIGAERICQKLNDMAIPSPYGIIWKRSTVMKIIENEVYIGKIRHGRRVANHKVVNQEIIKGTRYVKDYEVYDGRHEAIIDDSLFYSVQNKRASLPKYKIGTELKNPLASIIRCKCGSCLDVKYHRGALRYVCSSQTYCHNASVPLDDVMAEVSNYLQKWIDDFKVSMQNIDDSQYDQHMEHITFLERKLEDAEKQELSLWELYSKNGMPKPIFEKLISKCTTEKQNLEDTLAKARNNIPQKIDYHNKIIRFHEAIETINDSSISAATKNQLLRTIIERIEYSRPAAVRMGPKEAKEKGVVTNNGWYTPSFELDIYLLL